MDPDLLPDSIPTLEECDCLLADYEAAGADQYASLVIQLKRRRNALLPISSLPRELRYEIFDLILPRHRVVQVMASLAYSGFYGSDSPSSSYYSSLFILRLVSCSWDLEICDTAPFWNVISTLFPPPFQELILQRSQNVAMNVEVTRNESYFLETVPMLVEGEIAFLEKIRHRDIRGLEMNLPVEGDPSSYFIAVHRKLAALHISRDRQFEFTSPLLAPQLAYVCLFNITLPWDSLVNLRLLSLHGRYHLCLVQLFRVLSMSPLLEILELDRPLTAPFDDLPEEYITLQPVQMAHLTHVRLMCTPSEWISLLLDNLVAPACCSSTIVTEIVGQFNPAVLARQVGRLCSPIASSARMTPYLCMSSGCLSVELGDAIMFTLLNNDWNVDEPENGFSLRSHLIRIFLEECKGPRFQDPIQGARLRYDTRPSGFEGIKIIDNFFPNTRSLHVTADVDTIQIVQGLSASRRTEDGSLEWWLPELTELQVGTTAFKSRRSYDSVVDKVIERAQSAALSTSAFLPITELTLSRGTVRRESLTKLEELGIQYSLHSVKVIQTPTPELS
ncbi:hypothetical protein FS837_012495 [Tulasnella sp. UAMH 9824]|nr:hypothetical protein FS837_012495 [Tulasnella sp. UAMH 9824]